MSPLETLAVDATRPEPRPIKQFLVGLCLFLVAVGSAIVSTEVLTRVLAANDAQGLSWLPFTLALGIEAVVSSMGFLWLIPRLAGRLPFELMGPCAWKELSVGLAIGAIPVALAALVLWWLGVFRVTDISLNGGIISGLMLGVGAAFGEEIFFRGFLLRLLDKRFSSWAAMVSVSLLFALIHLTNPGATLWGAIAIMITAGPVLNAAYLLTRRLWLPIGIHLAWNAVQAAILGIDVSGSGSGRGLFESRLVGSELLTGGSMGIEGSLVLVLPAAMAGAVLVVVVQRKGRMLPPRA
jgi:membrane protease YdiL (CAAX protease family)